MPSVFRCFLFLWALAAIGCDDASHCMDCGGFGIPYLPPTSPENQIENIEIAYRERDCQGYTQILAPEFIFKFQPIDANDIGTCFWTRDQDSTGACDSTGMCALFRSGEVSDIRLDLSYSDRDTSTNFPGTALDSVRIRVIANLQVHKTDGTTRVISGQQDLYFRMGLAALREDPRHWFLYEWDDLPVLHDSTVSQGVAEETRAFGSL